LSSATAVLFDAPGPRARRRHFILTVLGALGIAAVTLLLIRALAAKDQFTLEKWQPFADPVTWTAYLLPGLRGTLVAAFFSVILAIIFGIALGIGRLSGLAPVRWACGAFVEFFRAVPVLMMMLFAYYVCLFALQISGNYLALYGVVAGLTFYNSSVIAELIRSGVGALPSGQREAGLAIGLTPFATLWSILLPQAITLMLPSIISQLVVILKDSALGFLILYEELTRSGQTLASSKGNLIPTFIVIAVIYIVVNYALTLLARRLERRLQRSKRGLKPPPEDVELNPEMLPVAAEATGRSRWPSTPVRRSP
jgi:glutamate transport system permease protein